MILHSDHNFDEFKEFRYTWFFIAGAIALCSAIYGFASFLINITPRTEFGWSGVCASILVFFMGTWLIVFGIGVIQYMFWIIYICLKMFFDSKST